MWPPRTIRDNVSRATHLQCDPNGSCRIFAALLAEVSGEVEKKVVPAVNRVWYAVLDGLLVTDPQHLTVVRDSAAWNGGLRDDGIL